MTAAVLVAAALLWPAPTLRAAPATETGAGGGAATAEASISDYYDALEEMGLLDVETGTRDSLRVELRAAEAMLQSGASVDAAVALYAIVESPRYAAFEDFIEYHNAEYDLIVALAAVGAYDSALRYLERGLARGTDTMYFEAGHRRAIDIALETRDYAGVLAMLERVTADMEVPAEARGEQAYLQARIGYANGDLEGAAEGLAEVDEKSRLYSSSVYLRGVIRTRQGQFEQAAEALCKVADLPDDDPMAFVVDDRYYTIKDLARLGLGRIAHEQGEYDDAYYHYFQIPDDSDRLPEALFEAAWSMYQKRDLDAARDLLDELFAAFPGAPQIPEARLLAGYIELADCRFDDAQAYYDRVVNELQPVVDEIERIRRDPARRRLLFDRAIERWRAERADPTRSVAARAPASSVAGGDASGEGSGEDEGAEATVADAPPPADQVLAYLRLDPKFLRLHEAVRGLRRAAGDAPHGVRTWTGLGRQVGDTRVRAVASEATIEQEDAADANALVEDVRRLSEELARARAELTRGEREGTLPADAAQAERQRLNTLSRRVAELERRATRAATAADAAIEAGAAPSLRTMIRADLGRARRLAQASRALDSRLEAAADRLAQQAIDRLYGDIRRVLDKAKLGKIDAVIGQKRRLDIEVSDLAAGRFPAELTGRLWEEGLIGDDEEFWPFEGEYWADEYEGWR
ncbi:hypothetical protein [Haliangium sp.]|uniref:hypothetical protein n=1 Tax=Haliangium sp. TaxID=2663208 RepID=UPI003D10C724